MREAQVFFEQNPVFTLAEFRAAFGKSKNEKTTRNLISYYLHRDRLCRVGEGGVYCTVPAGLDPDSFVPDRFLAVSKLRSDAVIAYHSAFEFLGRANQVFTTTYYTSSRYKPPLTFRGTTFHCVRRPNEGENELQSGVIREARGAMRIAVTNAERTTLDCLDRPRYGGGWEEICRCVVSLPMLDLDWILTYLRERSKPTLTAKVGYLVEAYRERLYANEALLKELERISPRWPVTLDRKRGGIFASRWNLVVPEELARAVKETR